MPTFEAELLCIYVLVISNTLNTIRDTSIVELMCYLCITIIHHHIFFTYLRLSWFIYMNYIIPINTFAITCPWMMFQYTEWVLLVICVSLYFYLKIIYRTLFILSLAESNYDYTSIIENIVVECATKLVIFRLAFEISLSFWWEKFLYPNDFPIY